jgi:hypothetical protein
MRSFLRWLTLSAAGGLVLAIAAGVVAEFFIELARERGWYDNPSQRLDAAVNAFRSFVTQTLFISTTALVAGLALGAWLDLFLRHREINGSAWTVDARLT